jgi:hypothetical protein
LIAYIDGMIDRAGLSASTDLDRVNNARVDPVILIRRLTTRADADNHAGIEVKQL